MKKIQTSCKHSFMSITHWNKVVLKPLKIFSSFSNIFPAYLLQFVEWFLFHETFITFFYFQKRRKDFKSGFFFSKVKKSVATLKKKNKKPKNNSIQNVGLNDHRQNVENEMNQKRRLFHVCECWTENQWFVPCSKCTHPLAALMVLYGSAKLNSIHGQAHTPYWISAMNAYAFDNIFPCHTPHDRK